MKLKILASVWGLALGMLPLTGWSYAFESSAQFARWKSGDYIIANDVWGKTDAGAQTLWANSGSNWASSPTRPARPESNPTHTWNITSSPTQ